jgi:hypothetical protein
MNGAGVRRTSARVTRREAATILNTSYENVKRLQRIGQLHSDPDRHGVHRFDRREVEELARRRGLKIKPSGELAARVFRMFKERRAFQDIVIETEQEPDVIRALWTQFSTGLHDGGSSSETEDRAERRHEELMRELERELERRRRATLRNEG